MEKEMKIVIPEGYEIDKEKSSFEKIVFKKKELEKWRDNPTNKLTGYRIDNNSRITFILGFYNSSYNYNVFATVEQARSALAMARISQIMKNDKRFGGVVTNEEWLNDKGKFCIESYQGNIRFFTYWNNNRFLAFHTKEQRELFLQENKDLIKEYLMIE
jgi:hypothetical protein